MHFTPHTLTTKSGLPIKIHRSSKRPRKTTLWLKDTDTLVWASKRAIGPKQWHKLRLTGAMSVQVCLPTSKTHTLGVVRGLLPGVDEWKAQHYCFSVGCGFSHGIRLHGCLQKAFRTTTPIALRFRKKWFVPISSPNPLVYATYNRSLPPPNNTRFPIPLPNQPTQHCRILSPVLCCRSMFSTYGIRRDSKNKRYSM